MSKGIGRLLEDRDLASRLTAAALSAVRERFSLETIGEKYLQLYREVSGNDDSLSCAALQEDSRPQRV